MTALPLERVVRARRHWTVRMFNRFAVAVGLSLLFWSAVEVFGWFDGDDGLAPSNAAPLVVETMTLKAAEDDDRATLIDLEDVRWRMDCPLLVVSGAWIGAEGELHRAASEMVGDGAAAPLPRAITRQNAADSAEDWRVRPGPPPAGLPPPPHRFALVVEAPRTLPCTGPETTKPWAGVARIVEVVVPGADDRAAADPIAAPSRILF